MLNDIINNKYKYIRSYGVHLVETQLEIKVMTLKPYALGINAKLSGLVISLGTVFIFSTPAQAIDLTAGDWTLSVNGNVNAHYLYTVCDPGPSPEVAGNVLICQSSENVSSVTNGVLPSTLQTSVKTTQLGWDLKAFFGFWTGSVANAGITDLSAVDVRQVFLTFGKEDIGTFKLGRDFGLFGLDAVLNDMSLVGVGASAAVQSPLNTQLAGIGYGYIYADRLSQINYTTPDLNGLSATIGIFQPLDLSTLGANSLDAIDSGSAAPGVQARVAYNFDRTVKGFISATAVTQNVKAQGSEAVADYQAYGLELTAVFNVGVIGAVAYGYYASGLGSVGLFFDAVDASGEARDSYGGMAQVTTTLGKTKIGVNGGLSCLEQTDNDPDTNIFCNIRGTGGIYHALTKNLQLLFEGTYMIAENHGGEQLTNATFNAGAFLSF
ncbi:MAG: porin [Myxococcales bacterium]|nr:porin [Myxococcales bacterium]